MSDPSRIDELEQRFVHQEKAMAELNDVITAQWKKIDMLELALKRLRDEMQNLNLRSEGEEPPPPHY
jgi:SlyX protein